MPNDDVATPRLRTANDLGDALMEVASRAAAGTADVAQAKVLCQVVDTLVGMTHLVLEVEKKGSGVPGARWLQDGISTQEADRKVSRLSEARREEAVLVRSLDDSKTPENKREMLQGKLNNVQQEIMLLERSLSRVK
jgi:hypothetical protein